MDIFKEIRERVNIVDVCEAFGINLNRSYKSVCPFHNEKTASFSVSPTKNIFCCFGCGKKGDSVTLIQNLLNISPLEAAKSINNILNLGIDENQKTTTLELNKYKVKRKTEEKFKQWESKIERLLFDYLYLLDEWEKTANMESDLFAEAMHNKDYVEYLINELFVNETNENKVWFWKNGKKLVKAIESRVEPFRPVN